MDRELKDASAAAHQRELRELTQSILLETKGRFVKHNSESENEMVYMF